MSGTYRQGFLLGGSQSAESASDLLQDAYDFLFCVSSWDSRCLAISRATALRASVGCLVLFDVRDDLGLRDRHDRELQSFCNTSCGRHSIVRGNSADPKRVWQSIENVLREAYQQVGKPLSVLVDLCTCPRFFALAILSRGFLSGIAAKISFFYAEGIYPPETSTELKHELFTSGGWHAVPVPGLEGQWMPDYRRLYFVSVGFEGSKTLRLVCRSEPDRVGILFPDPGVQPEYVDRAWKHNQHLINRFALEERDIVRAPAGDAIEAWRAMGARHIELPDENVCYLCCGTKAHSLALGLRALVLRRPAVLYIVPDRHNVVDVRASGVYWRYDIRDMTSLEGVPSRE